MNTYPSGTLVRTSAINWTQLGGGIADPTTITLKYRAGGGSITTVTYPNSPIVRDSQGNYHADLDTTGFAGPGLQLWEVEWIGTGTVQVIGNDSWQVSAPTL